MVTAGITGALVLGGAGLAQAADQSQTASVLAQTALNHLGVTVDDAALSKEIKDDVTKALEADIVNPSIRQLAENNVDNGQVNNEGINEALDGQLNNEEAALDNNNDGIVGRDGSNDGSTPAPTDPNSGASDGTTSPRNTGDETVTGASEAANSGN